MLNQTELRRKKLLEYTRDLYSDNRKIPAVHPRYRMSYQQLYNNEQKTQSGSFGFRVGICMMLFALYIVMGNRGGRILGMDDMQVFEKIMQNIL